MRAYNDHGVSRRHISCLLASLAAVTLNGSTPSPAGADHVATRSVLQLPKDAPDHLFISGHSLTDPPFADYLAHLAQGEGRAFHWGMQSLAGSSLQDRSRAAVAHAGSGDERSVITRSGSDSAARALGADNALPYDALLLAEQHTLLESLIWKDTIGSAVDYIEHFTAANTSGPVYLFTTWLNLDDQHDPARWLSYERAAAHAWQCTSARIAHLSNSRVTLIPAADALATLVEEALAGRVPWISGERASDTLRKIFIDDVHLTPAGTYFTALVTHGVMQGGLAHDLWTPATLDGGTGAALQDVARAYLATRGELVRTDERACRAYLAERFVPAYLHYVRDARWRREGTLHAYLKWIRFRLAWPHLLQSDRPDNPWLARRDPAPPGPGENAIPPLPNAPAALPR